MDLKQDLKALRAALPFGAIQRIANQIGRTRNHVVCVLEQKYQDDQVIDLAIEEAIKERDRKKMISKKIKTAISV